MREHAPQLPTAENTQASARQNAIVQFAHESMHFSAIRFRASRAFGHPVLLVIPVLEVRICQYFLGLFLDEFIEFDGE
jgi:hypothetical protein